MLALFENIRLFVLQVENYSIRTKLSIRFTPNIMYAMSFNLLWAQNTRLNEIKQTSSAGAEGARVLNSKYGLEETRGSIDN